MTLNKMQPDLLQSYSEKTATPFITVSSAHSTFVSARIFLLLISQTVVAARNIFPANKKMRRNLPQLEQVPTGHPSDSRCRLPKTRAVTLDLRREIRKSVQPEAIYQVNIIFILQSPDYFI